MTTIQTNGERLRPMSQAERAFLAERVRAQAEADATEGRAMIADMLSAAQLIAYEGGGEESATRPEIDPADISQLTRETYAGAFLVRFGERVELLADIVAANGVPDPLNCELERPGRYLAVQRGDGDYQGIAWYSPGTDVAAALEGARPVGSTWQAPEVYDLATGEVLEGVAR